MIKHLKILTILLLAFLLTGCASVDYSRVVEKSGKVTDKVIVTLDLNKIASSGYSVNVLVANIVNDLELLYLTNVQSFIKDSMLNENLSAEVKSNISENITTSTQITQDKTKIISTITYNNSEVFNLYYSYLKNQNPTPPNEEQDKEEKDKNVEVLKNFFFTTYIQSSENAYGDIVNGTLSPIFNKYYGSLNYGEKFTLNDLKLSQTYGSYNTDLKSNADIIKTKDGIKLHYWKINPTNNITTLKFFSYTPNIPMWYLFALMLSISVAIVILFYGILKHNNPFAKKVITTKE